VIDTPANRRKHPRISPLLIRADFSTGFGEKVHRAYITNLSDGGAFLATPEVVPIGSTIKLGIMLPWEVGRIDVEAEVVWKRAGEVSTDDDSSAGLGLQFVTIGQDSTDKLKLYFEKFTKLAARLLSPVS
jgi:Tfp pilus assembly protein PilZ